PMDAGFPKFSDENVIEICSGKRINSEVLMHLVVKQRMIEYKITSCIDYFCSEQKPIFLQNSTNHKQMITYCLYCNRTDYYEFQQLQCTHYMDRNSTCPPGKCRPSDICIDSHVIFSSDGRQLADMSTCYLPDENRFVYSTDFYH